jgi:hypothetical protein
MKRCSETLFEELEVARCAQSAVATIPQPKSDGQSQHVF